MYTRMLLGNGSAQTLRRQRTQHVRTVQVSCTVVASWTAIGRGMNCCTEPVLTGALYMLYISRWSEPASELYRPSDSRLSTKSVTTFADRGCHVISMTDPNCRILGFLYRSRYFFFQVAPQLYSRGWVDPVPDPLHIRKSGSAGTRTRTSWTAARNSDH
jgi:hypothetical protein